jgi:transposase-like protein
MDAPSIADVSEQLIGDLAEILPESRDRRWRCPAALRARVVAYAKACRDRGETIEDVAARLGLVGGTLARWLRRDREDMAAGFRSVAIVAAEEGVVTDDRPVRLISPRGYCVEGLDAQTLAYLLQVVG